MTGVYLFLGLGVGFGLIGAVCGWVLCRWHDQTARVRDHNRRVRARRAGIIR
jgi:hypothetical protein